MKRNEGERDERGGFSLERFQQLAVKEERRWGGGVEKMKIDRGVVKQCWREGCTK